METLPLSDWNIEFEIKRENLRNLLRVLGRGPESLVDLSYLLPPPPPPEFSSTKLPSLLAKSSSPTQTQHLRLRTSPRSTTTELLPRCSHLPWTVRHLRCYLLLPPLRSAVASSPASTRRSPAATSSHRSASSRLRSPLRQATRILHLQNSSHPCCPPALPAGPSATTGLPPSLVGVRGLLPSLPRSLRLPPGGRPPPERPAALLQTSSRLLKSAAPSRHPLPRRSFASPTVAFLLSFSLPSSISTSSSLLERPPCSYYPRPRKRHAQEEEPRDSFPSARFLPPSHLLTCQLATSSCHFAALTLATALPCPRSLPPQHRHVSPLPRHQMPRFGQFDAAVKRRDFVPTLL